MKRLAVLLLAMLLCFTLISCDTPEESSSSSSEEASESSVDEIPCDIEYSIIPRQVSSEYVHYNVVASESLKGVAKAFQKWIFDDYVAFNSFVSSNSNVGVPDSINEKLFEENFVLIIYRKHDFFRENYCYGDFSLDSNDSKYTITFEYTVYPDKLQEQMEIPDSLDIVIVPKSACDEAPNAASVYLKALEHKYTYKCYIVE